MTDLRSRADELIDSAIEDARAETFNPSKYTREQAKESHAALTRFVHALCECAEALEPFVAATHGADLLRKAATEVRGNPVDGVAAYIWHSVRALTVSKFETARAALAEVEKVGG